MAQIDYIKDLNENGYLSLQEISRRTGHSFQTVQKYAYQEDWSREKLPNMEAEIYPNLEKYIPSIDEWTEMDRKLPRKQRHTVMRIYPPAGGRSRLPWQLQQCKAVRSEEKIRAEAGIGGISAAGAAMRTRVKWASERACI